MRDYFGRVRTANGTAWTDYAVEVFDANAEGVPASAPRADAVVTDGA